MRMLLIISNLGRIEQNNQNSLVKPFALPTVDFLCGTWKNISTNISNGGLDSSEATEKSLTHAIISSRLIRP